MEYYRKFAVQMTALVMELSETALPSESDDIMTVDGPTARMTMKMANEARQTMNHHMEYQLGEERKRLRSLKTKEATP